MEVVDENRAQISVSPLLKEEEIPKTVFKPSSSSPSKVPSLIPLTVSEIDETESKLASQSLHMSGGGVYTTDSFFSKCINKNMFAEAMKFIKKKQNCIHTKSWWV